MNSFLSLTLGRSLVNNYISFIAMRIFLMVRYVVFNGIYITNKYFIEGIVLLITIHINIKKITIKINIRLKLMITLNFQLLANLSLIVE